MLVKQHRFIDKSVYEGMSVASGASISLCRDAVFRALGFNSKLSDFALEYVLPTPFGRLSQDEVFQLCQDIYPSRGDEASHKNFSKSFREALDITYRMESSIMAGAGVDDAGHNQLFLCIKLYKKKSRVPHAEFLVEFLTEPGGAIRTYFTQK